ncbi:MULTISPECIES: ABC transporter ATP-binding protein [unclassified Neochlamydia]|uniref:ABC transporter ATP-binding protein n=1 Tax=unclassified Neochlamydia TaxID=2643326 RepID=UPI001BC9097E|nr:MULTISPECIES: ABC transporter ATP-binding protein [unclassified Neochlamydia]
MINVLSVQNLTKIYPGKIPFTAIDKISFDLKKGEILGLLGPNGSGKTTTIQMLLGTLAYTSGAIFYFQQDFAHARSDILEKVSFASTYTSLPWILTVKENLEVFGLLYGLTRKESALKFDPLLERFGILGKRNQRVASLSAGQVTRLMLVKAFFTNPQIVLLDEPTASLDPDIASDICSFLLEQRDKKGLSILFSSHKMEEVMEVCDRTIFLKEGKIIADDLPEKLAKSISAVRVKLCVQAGLNRTIAVASTAGFKYSVDHRNIEILIEEDKIPAFLHALSKEGVNYVTIKIKEPSLDDFFHHIAKQKR